MDYYKALGVLPTATPEEITAAYRRIAMKNHPDRNPDNEKALQRFKEAQAAYEVLSDHQKRGSYDREQLNRIVEDPFVAAKAAWENFIDNTLQPLQ